MDDLDKGRFTYLRQRALERCVRCRLLIKGGDRTANDVLYTSETMAAVLRNEQTNLLKLRIWRATGRYPRAVISGLSTC